MTERRAHDYEWRRAHVPTGYDARCTVCHVLDWVTPRRIRCRFCAQPIERVSAMTAVLDLDRAGKCPWCGRTLHTPHQDCEYDDTGLAIELQRPWCAACGWEEGDVSGFAGSDDIGKRRAT